MKPYLLALLAILLLSSCWRRFPRESKRVLGYRPIYNDSLNVSFTTPRAMLKAGKIYVKDQYIYQLDQNRGIHVFDKTNPAALKEIGFIEVQGASEIAISGNHLITNAYTELVVIDITDLSTIKLISRVKNAFSAHENIPVNLPEHGVYYECIQGNRGTVTGWLKDSVYNTCYFE